MLIVENIQVFNFEGAMRGLRNPKDSWHLSDSKFDQTTCLLPDSAAEDIEKCENCPLFEGWGKDTKWNTSLFHLTMSYAAIFMADIDLNKLF